MKARIFLYLFLFALLLVIFQYANNKRYYESKEKEISKMEERLNEQEIQLKEAASGSSESNDTDGFSLQTNSHAKEFFEDQGMDIDSLAKVIENEVISKNSSDADNPLIPYSGSEGSVMRINRIKILNNRWILAEFTDGNQWGEAIISYFLDENNDVQFDTQDGVLYSR